VRVRATWEAGSPRCETIGTGRSLLRGGFNSLASSLRRPRGPRRGFRGGGLAS
jgi:hypothetical protein